MRLVSLLPSTTEILHAIGAGGDVVGVTFECDYPSHARDVRIVSTSAMPEGLSPHAIDEFVTAAMQRGDDLYHLDAGALSDLDADLVLTQDLCAVCAVDVSVVDDALAHLGCTAEVLTVDPHTLDEVLESIETIGVRVGRDRAASALVAELRRRLAAVVAAPSRRRVMLLEWTEPPFAPGHWIPEMIERAGGEALLGHHGRDSVRVSWDDVRRAAPDVVVVAPCGFDLAGCVPLAERIVAELPDGVEVWAVDANASFARPGPRLVDGVEAMAALLKGEPHPLAQRIS